jgi:hypothetical protein
MRSGVFLVCPGSMGNVRTISHLLSPLPDRLCIVGFVSTQMMDAIDPEWVLHRACQRQGVQGR